MTPVNPSAKGPRKRAEAVFERVTRLLGQQFRTPREGVPSTRVVSRKSLLEWLGILEQKPEIRQIRHRFTVDELLGHWKRMGLAREVPIKLPSKLTSPLYVIEFGASADPDYEPLFPLDLLMATEPKGFVCYFTALQVHNLTTQLPAHHHVARLVAPSVARQSAPTSAPLPQPGLARRKFDPLGTRLFTFEGIPFYLTKRDPALVPGIRSTTISDRLLLRATTREQTLLDTLHRPVHCGGVDVCMEAWSTALDRIDYEGLADLIRNIGRDELARRAGAMLDIVQGRTTPLLIQTLDEVGGGGARTPIPLFPGIPGRNLEKRWQVMLPFGA